MSVEKKVKRNKSNKKQIFKIAKILFLIAFFVIVGIMIRDKVVENRAQKQFEELQQPVVETVETEASTEADPLVEMGIVVPEKNLNWDELKKTNEHIYAWIYIPNTNVDYPVLQHPTDDRYYLDYNLDGTKGYPGCIYSEHRYNSTDFMDFNTLLSGHNMKNGTMFKTLHYFEDRGFFEENRYMYVYTLDEVYVYDIFAAYENQAQHILVVYDNETDTGRQQYLNDLFGIRNMSAHFRDGVEVTTDSKILTLVTCTNNSNTRYFVQGVMVNEVGEE